MIRGPLRRLHPAEHISLHLPLSASATHGRKSVALRRALSPNLWWMLMQSLYKFCRSHLSSCHRSGGRRVVRCIIPLMGWEHWHSTLLIFPAEHKNPKDSREQIDNYICSLRKNHLLWLWRSHLYLFYVSASEDLKVLQGPIRYLVWYSAHPVYLNNCMYPRPRGTSYFRHFL